MRTPSLAQAIYKLSIAGEQAGFSIEIMIQLLNAGLTVDQLLSLIDWRLNHPPISVDRALPYRWIM